MGSGRGAGAVKLAFKPTRALGKLLRTYRRLRVTLTISYAPTGGTASVRTRTVMLTAQDR